MQNFSLLKRVGAAIAGTDHGVVLKRGLSATVEEWLLAAEYVTSSGGDNVVLCERGIRTFETSTRFTLDLSAVIVAQRLTDLDRKSTRLNSSHANISYGVLCLINKNS